MKITPEDAPRFGVEIDDLDLRCLRDEDVTLIKDLVYQHKLVAFHGQKLEKAEYLEVARRFGRPQVYFQSHYHHPEHPEIFVSSNVPENGQKVGVAGTGRFWHSDYQMFDEPLSLTMVYPQVLPSVNRETHFVDMERVYANLPEKLHPITDGTMSFHEATWYYKVQPEDIDRPIIDLVREFREICPGAVHPTVIRHPITGRPSLYVSEGFTTAILGLEDGKQQDALQELLDYVGREEHVQVWRWTDGDILFWDNRTLIHRACNLPPGEPSVSYRIGVYDGLPFYTNEVDRRIPDEIRRWNGLAASR